MIGAIIVALKVVLHVVGITQSNVRLALRPKADREGGPHFKSPAFLFVAVKRGRVVVIEAPQRNRSRPEPGGVNATRVWEHKGRIKTGNTQCKTARGREDFFHKFS